MSSGDPLLAPAEAEASPRRLARAGARVAALGMATVETAGRLRALASADAREGARERARVLRDASRRILHLHGVEVDADGPRPIGPAMLASNHLSWLDPLVVASLVPCAPVSKADVSRWPVIGSIARDLGVVFVSRGDARSGARALQAAADVLAHGVPVLNFPEGTTSTGESVLPFRHGSFGLALRAGVPVVPVALRYDPPSVAWVGDATFLPHYLTLASRRRARARVRFGAPVVPGPSDGAPELARAVRAEVQRLLEEDTWPSSAPSST
jgi:lyso-ornithine lipid O-acyltransferase